MRAAVDAFLPGLEAAFKGFPAVRKKRSGGRSVSLLAVFTVEEGWDRDGFVDRLRRAHERWAKFVETSA